MAPMAPSRAPAFICASCTKALASRNGRHAVRAFSVSAAQSAPAQDVPRWQQTPPAMKMRFRVRPQPRGPAWKVNDRQEPVDEMYDNFIGRVVEAAQGQEGVTGPRGSDLLPEEVKWLAVTHKSFDHGRRGFNDKLAFFGKRIIDLQTSMALIRAPQVPSPTQADPNVFQHPSLDGVENLTPSAKAQMLAPARLSQLARSYGLDRVLRWQPRKTGDMQSSGVDTVLAHTVYSIIGALALHRGGEIAGRVARERVLEPLGLR
ncbi:Ribonuclease-III-like [Teratosphaeria destructans]|uniref:Ribonuclease-III-like n=1 Tax=Teratosphaeria destructans TaxID=418781 RepID=A0A9W7VXQ2_9PEZI|nr:Ribonuclease-III-like [Teratosphaeria destructans]